MQVLAEMSLLSRRTPPRNINADTIFLETVICKMENARIPLHFADKIDYQLTVCVLSPI